MSQSKMIRHRGAGSGRRGRRFILSAPSGAGKTTLCQALRQHFPDIRYSVSYTTRSPRTGERDGVDYHFISPEAFQAGLERGAWAEWAEVHGNRYGTSAEFLENTVVAGEDVLLDIDVQGARQILERFPDSITIFIMPPSMAALKERLTARGADTPETIERRMANASGEISQRHLYRHVIVNDRLEQAVSELIELVGAYRGQKEQGP
jgi:guanylate kinase